MSAPADLVRSTEGFAIRPLAPGDGAWRDALLGERWGGPLMVTRGRVHDLRAVPGFVAIAGAAWIGLATYRVAGDECELLSLDSAREGRGVGTALIDAVRAAAEAACCRRLWLITTNDNLAALRFYQRRGFLLAALHRGAIARSRLLKPQIALTGDHGIPIRDEIELELPLGRAPGRKSEGRRSQVGERVRGRVGGWTSGLVVGWRW